MEPPTYTSLIMPTVPSSVESGRTTVLMLGSWNILKDAMMGFLPPNVDLEKIRVSKQTFSDYRIWVYDLPEIKLSVEFVLADLPSGCTLPISPSILQRVQYVFYFMNMFTRRDQNGKPNGYKVRCFPLDLFRGINVPYKTIGVIYTLNGNFYEGSSINHYLDITTASFTEDGGTGDLSIPIIHNDQNRGVINSFYKLNNPDSKQHLASWVIPILQSLVLSNQEKEAIELVRRMVQEGRVRWPT